ncbi:adenine-specific DNA methylase [Thermus oshimai JL-2]|uniref:site-specific DNA-methyltransferase (adenine-specific) n=1 Tax=Thermus oshimai JL-2 TaxID=751945 RepID=K7QXV0_THEOS|nr:DNA adenine methylase [Thermus oshimai]AFV75285.1 adenine-specific DNA methylase [Thermus oshimai JL-2]
MIKYIGSKRALIPLILGVLDTIQRSGTEIRTALDPFTGSTRVAHSLKSRGIYVFAGDYLNFSYTLARALIAADARDYPPTLLNPILSELNALEGNPGWFTRIYSQEARFFQEKNARRIEAIRNYIEEHFSDSADLKAILLTSLILAADKVDSTTGVQMAYLKKWAPRSFNDLLLLYPPLLPGRGEAIWGDALHWVGQVEVDFAYIDPPYNSHSYLGNYHLWETLVLWDNPVVYGVARKRLDVRSKKSPFNSKRQAQEALKALLKNLRAKVTMVSFNNEGFLSLNQIVEMAKEMGFVVVIEKEHKRYIGSVIGVFNPKGEKVGEVSHTKNKEYLIVILQDSKVKRAIEERFVNVKAIQQSLF